MSIKNNNITTDGNKIVLFNLKIYFTNSIARTNGKVK